MTVDEEQVNGTQLIFSRSDIGILFMYSDKSLLSVLYCIYFTKSLMILIHNHYASNDLISLLVFIFCSLSVSAMICSYYYGHLI